MSSQHFLSENEWLFKLRNKIINIPKMIIYKSLGKAPDITRIEHFWNDEKLSSNVVYDLYQSQLHCWRRLFPWQGARVSLPCEEGSSASSPSTVRHNPVVLATQVISTCLTHFLLMNHHVELSIKLPNLRSSLSIAWRHLKVGRDDIVIQTVIVSPYKVWLVSVIFFTLHLISPAEDRVQYWWPPVLWHCHTPTSPPSSRQSWVGGFLRYPEARLSPGINMSV